MLKQRGHGDVLKGQVLIYPVVDHAHAHYESYHAYGGGDYLLTHEDMVFFMEAYYGSKEASKDIRSAPLLATLEELKGVPRALVLTAECDVLRDQGEAYARHLTAAGVDAVGVRLIGATHGFATVPIETPQYRQSLTLITNFLNKEAFEQ
jgi:acetyl esterase